MNNNQWTTKQIIEDLDLLSRKGVVGFYSRCEITEIFLFKKKGPKEQQTLNLLTLVVFEEASITAAGREYLTPKGGIKIQIEDASYDRCGIQRYYVTPEQLKIHLEAFMKSNNMESNIWNPSGQPDENLKTSKLTFLPKQYVPADSTYSVALNSILKNNFHCGSYLLEGFDEDKKDKDVDLLLRDTVALDSLSESIRKCIPISIAKLTDRLGNIILQFPITILSSEFSVKQQTEVHVEIVWHPKTEPRPCEVITLTELDGHFLGFGQLEKPNQENFFNVPSGNSSSTGIKNILFDKKNQLILAFQIISSVQKSHSGKKCGESKPRIFTIPGETHTQEIELIRQYPEVKYPGRFDWIENRLVEDGRKQLEDRLSFVQYGKGKKNERDKALKDIRKLITRYGEEGVCLWDPFLSATDILQTLYFCESYNAPLKAISSKKANVSKKGIEQWITDEAKTLKENPGNNFGLNLEFRIQHGDHGWKFHDRFLIFPCTRTKVKAWSLGTSVKSLGKSHHILQEVSNAQHVLKAFNELWKKLADPSCTVWEIGNDKQSQ